MHSGFPFSPALVSPGVRAGRGRGEGQTPPAPAPLVCTGLSTLLSSPQTGPVLTVQPAKDEGGKGPSGVSRRVSGTCLSSEETVPSFVPGLSRSSESRPKVDKQVPGGPAASSLFLGGEERRAPWRTPAPHPFLPTATGADLSVFDPSITRKRLVRLRKNRPSSQSPE